MSQEKLGKPKTTVNQEAPAKNKGGRPSKKEKLNEEGLKLCFSFGFTDEQTALALQITRQTLDNWKHQDPEFFASLKRWKESADFNVSRSLYQRACGGRWGDKYYPPDPTSMIFWLKNRQPEKWRDKVETEHSGNIVLNAPAMKKCQKT